MTYGNRPIMEGRAMKREKTVVDAVREAVRCITSTDSGDRARASKAHRAIAELRRERRLTREKLDRPASV